MLYRDLEDPAPPLDADVDTAAMAETAAAAERAAWHVKILGEAAEISLALTRSLGELALARVEAARTENRALAPDDVTTLAALDKAAQTLRRTVALRDKLDGQATARREGLQAERIRRRAERAAAHESAKTETVLDGLADAYAAQTTDAEYNDHIDDLMADARDYLDDADADEFRGWLGRPVGETVARLCAAVNLDPDSCKMVGDAWRVRRPPRDFELFLERRDRALAAAASASAEEALAECAPSGLSP
jgi:hypothetical protein